MSLANQDQVQPEARFHRARPASQRKLGQRGCELDTPLARDLDFGGQPLSRSAQPNTSFTIGSGFEPEAPNLEHELEKLRRKIETNPKEPAGLITVRGAGYRLLTAD